MDKGKVISIHKGYYHILPAQYAGKGVFAAALVPGCLYEVFGQTLLCRPAKRCRVSRGFPPTTAGIFCDDQFPGVAGNGKRGMKINYISVEYIPEVLVEQRKTEAGYLNVSKAALTEPT